MNSQISALVIFLYLYQNVKKLKKGSFAQYADKFFQLEQCVFLKDFTPNIPNTSIHRSCSREKMHLVASVHPSVRQVVCLHPATLKFCSKAQLAFHLLDNINIQLDCKTLFSTWTAALYFYMRACGLPVIASVLTSRTEQ